MDPGYIKAYYRRGSANYALGKLKLALKDFKAVVSIVPGDADAQKKTKQCEKALKEEAFQKAIESEVVPDVPIDIDSIVVEDSYTGPILELRRSSEEAEKGTMTTVTPVVTPQFVQQLIEHFKAQKKLHRKYVLAILQEMINRLKTTPSLLRLYLPPIQEDDASFTVCGDTHGQFYDLCNIFQLGGMPSSSRYYLFNGDYVDRGSFSFETVMTLIAIKLLMPNSLHMIRGNHETKYSMPTLPPPPPSSFFLSFRLRQPPLRHSPSGI